MQLAACWPAQLEGTREMSVAVHLVAGSCQARSLEAINLCVRSLTADWTWMAKSVLGVTSRSRLIVVTSLELKSTRSL